MSSKQDGGCYLFGPQVACYRRSQQAKLLLVAFSCIYFTSNIDQSLVGYSSRRNRIVKDPAKDGEDVALSVRRLLFNNNCV